MIILQSGIRRGIIARAPAVGGSLADGDVITVTIPGAGSNVSAANQEFLGGSWGPVEAAANGTVFDTLGLAGWAMPGATGTRVSNARALNGTKSLLNDRSLGSQFGIRFDTGGEQGACRFVWSIYVHNPDDAEMQLKQMRVVGSLLGGTSGIGDGDIANVYFRTLNSDSTGASEGVPVNNSAGNVVVSSVGTGLEDGAFGTWYGQGFWLRNEASVVRNSAPGVADGRLVIVSKNAATNEVIGRWVIPAYDFTSTDAFMRYLVWQGYMGNHVSDPSGIRLHLDRDWYAIWNASRTVPKSIQVGDASTYAACTTLIDQEYSAWTDVGGNAEIEFKFNQGRLPTAAGWAYALSDVDTVINSTGVALP